MAQAGEKFTCEICGNEVVVTNAGGGTLVCCGESMSVIGDGFSCK